MQIHLLDTGALLSQWIMKNPELSFVTTQSVIDEIQNKLSMNRVHNLISIGRLRVEYPTPEALETVKVKAGKIGDAHVLSDVDLELIALGFDHAQQSHDVRVVSTDLAVLNTASLLGLDITDPKGRMKHKIIWVLRCPACGNEEQEGAISLECPTCGTQMHRKSKKRKKLRFTK